MKLVFGGGGIGALALLAMLYAFPQHAQEQQEAEEATEPAGVTESELQLYIDVYATMQADHDLTIDSVLSSKNETLERFRSIEQRVQKEQRLVDRVRQSLHDQAMNRSASAALSKAATGGTTEPSADEKKKTDKERKEEDRQRE
jgi:hypothetical protein